MAGEKTEQATPKRKQEERKKGNTFQSKEIGVVLSLVAVFYSTKALGPAILSVIGRNLQEFIVLSGTQATLSMPDLTRYYIEGCIIFAMTALPLLLIAGFVTAVATAAQTRMLVSFQALQFKMSRLNPLQGIKKMFSLRGVIELLKSLLKITILGIVIYQVLKDEVRMLPNLMEMTVGQSMVFIGSVVLEIVKLSVIIMAFVAGFDYLYQWWDYEKNLRMSKQELKEEYKQTEGDPQIKGKIRERQQQMARRRMMQKVPSADVVIRNPTHFAVALQYDPKKNHAPIVIAKGMDHVALKIVEIAEQHHVPITENKPLAQGLYRDVELNREIPDQFFQPVAEVLAFVYNLKKKDLK